MKRLSEVLSLGILLLALGLSGCGGSETAAVKVKKDSVDVRTTQVTVEGAPVSITLPGRIQAAVLSEIRPRVDGIIMERLFEQGQEVKKGDTLYLIDPRLYEAHYHSARASFMQAQAALEIAEHNLQRYAKLRKTDSVSEEQYETVKLNFEAQRANAEAARSALEEARLNVEYTRVLSPIDGVAGISNLPVGALVTANQEMALTTVANLDEVFVDLEENVNEWQRFKTMRLFGDLTSDQQTSQVTLFIDGRPWSEPGQLISANPVVNATSGTVTLRSRFANKHHLLSPGMAVTARLNIGVNPHVMVIPVEAVLRTARNQTFVYVITSDSRVRRQEVELGLLTEKGYEVRRGLREGDEIVIEGLNSLKDGSSVRIVNLVEESDA